MKRLPALLLTLPMVLLAAPVLAADHRDNPLEPIFDFFNSAQDQVFVAKIVKEPVETRGSTTDPEGDFEHPTGQTPGYTPDHIDILGTRTLVFDPGALELFTPTGDGFWAETGPNYVESANGDPFHTFTGDIAHDGSQYNGGTFLFGFTVAAPPPVEVEGRCEYVVWINDVSRGPTFVHHPNFPGDPASGTNIAFGLGINPEGQEISSNFTLELSKTGGFAPNPETDIRSFISDDYVGITVPRGAIGQLAGVNFYTFCAASGFGFNADESGADQTGLIEMTEEDLGIMEVVATPAVAETTTTLQLSTTTITAGEPGPTTAETEEPTLEGRAFPWWLVLLGALGLGILAYWLLAMRGDPCKELARVWQDAEKACADAEGDADNAGTVCEEAQLELEGLEDDRKKICREWPPVCWETDDGGWVEDDRGHRITAREVHMRKMALGEIWSDYRAGKLSATQVEAKWKERDTPEFREEITETDRAFKDSLESVDAKIAIAREFADEACKRSTEARRRAEETCADTVRAKGAYEDCISLEGVATDPI